MNEQNETKTVAFQAVNKAGLPIITVYGVTETEARNEIANQLNRPGRYGIFAQWVDHGSNIRKITY